MRRAALAALVVSGLAAGVVLALVEWSPRTRPPTATEWIVQVAVLMVAALLVVRRATGKR